MYQGILVTSGHPAALILSVRYLKNVQHKFNKWTHSNKGNISTIILIFNSKFLLLKDSYNSKPCECHEAGLITLLPTTILVYHVMILCLAFIYYWLHTKVTPPVVQNVINIKSKALTITCNILLVQIFVKMCVAYLGSGREDDTKDSSTHSSH